MGGKKLFAKLFFVILSANKLALILAFPFLINLQ